MGPWLEREGRAAAQLESLEALWIDRRSFRLAPLVGLLSRLRRPWLDRALALGADPAASPYLSQRAAVLTSGHSRTRLIDSLALSRFAARHRGLGYGSRVTPHREEVARARAQFTELESILRSPQPVYCRGMALGWRLITDGASPLYAPVRHGELQEALADVIAALGGSR